MKTFAIAGSFLAVFLPIRCQAQSGAVIPQGGVGHATQASCIILKRMGPADEVTSHLYSFGIRGKQFQYVEGKLPEGFPFHGRLTDHDVRNLQSRGTEVLVLEAHYTAEDLKQAREDCRGETGKSPNQVDSNGQPAQTSDHAAVKTAPSQTPTPVSTPVSGPPTTPSSQTTNPPSPAQSQSTSCVLAVNSTQTGADIFVDDSFVGNTPSTVNIPAGKHTVVVRKTGFQDWVRTMNFYSGSITLSAELSRPTPDGQGDATKAPTSAAAPALPLTDPGPAPQHPVVPWIGVHAQNKGDAAVVTNVSAGGPAAKVGIQVGDIILALDGRLIKGRDFETIVATLKPGTDISVNYARGPAAHEVRLTVGSQD
jgi:PDZ domain/PEGA domain